MAKALQKISKPEAIIPLSPALAALAEKATADRSKMTLGVQRIVHKASIIKIDGKPVPDNKVKFAIVDVVKSKSYFAGGYVDGKVSVPTCYSYDEAGDATGNSAGSMRPHPASTDPQAEACQGCPHNVFGTALINGLPGGKGKRCKDELKIGVLMGATDAGSVNKAETRQFSVPPASLKAFGAFQNGLVDTTPFGVSGVVTEMGTIPQGASYGLTFRATDKLDTKFVEAMIAKQPALHAELLAPWPNIAEPEAPAPVDKKKAAARAGKR